MATTFQLLSSAKNPTLVLATRLGSLYNLIPSNQTKVEAVHLSIGDFLHLRDVIEQFPKELTLKKYLGYSENVLTYLAPHDSYKQSCMIGCNEDDTIKVFSNKGFTKLTGKQYFEMVNLIKPDIWVGFTQMPLLTQGVKSLSNKSILKAIKKSVSFLQMIKNQQKQGILLAPVHGANTEHLSTSMNEILKYEKIIDGLLLCDISSDVTNEEICQILKTIGKYTENKQLLICLAGQGKIQRFQLFKYGIKLFEVNYPFRLAQSNRAIIKQKGQVMEHDPVQLQYISPLSVGCDCLACRNYSQSYIAHLVKCHEMTANVLLTIHNLHQYNNSI